MVDGHQARKRFGQNFLHNPGIIQRIVNHFRLQAGEHVVEIGPGLGALTLPILQAGCRLDLVELDRDLLANLESITANYPDCAIHHSDALKFDFASLADGDNTPSLRVVGNLPYNISTPLLFHLFSFASVIKDMHFMLQKEVVDRMAAGPGSKTYGRLSVMTQYYCQVENLMTIGPGAFKPAPKVDSAIVRLEPHAPENQQAVDVTILNKVVTSAFSQRRKTLRNTWKGLLSTDDFDKLNIDGGERAENLPLSDFVKVANYYNNHKLDAAEQP